MHATPSISACGRAHFGGNASRDHGRKSPRSKACLSPPCLWARKAVPGRAVNHLNGLKPQLLVTVLAESASSSARTPSLISPRDLTALSLD
ncbi:hypothetical protein N656DRAFT_242521 [Canariomyces notabilis]|uniref:Uncharacterized protein n=1 Tax=Canariomyces notabilis TaxID=2074819 RepID=A0AAN6TLQ3_9PEZI|nr:hypothetical protein N656DRAFT_242521 [Canariomyces arenarius]